MRESSDKTGEWDRERNTKSANQNTGSTRKMFNENFLVPFVFSLCFLCSVPAPASTFAAPGWYNSQHA